MQYYQTFFICTGATDTFLRLGFCPSYVQVHNETDSIVIEWFQNFSSGGATYRALNGTSSLLTTTGIFLVKFTDLPHKLTADPSVVLPEEWYNANGIQIDSGSTGLTDGDLIHVMAFGMSEPHVVGPVAHYATTSQTYFQDDSADFIKAGVSGNGRFIIMNATNKNYAYIGKITKPLGLTNYCRLYTYTDAACENATTAAAFASGNKCYIIALDHAPYPLSDLGLMT